jgi:transcriptional regulator with XRE-family HTH domain
MDTGTRLSHDLRNGVTLSLPPQERNGVDVTAFRELLAADMERRRVTPRDMAQRIGKTRSTVYRYLEGTTVPPPAVAVRLAQALGVPAKRYTEPLLDEATIREAETLRGKPSLDAIEKRIAALQEERERRRLEGE